MIKSFSKSSIVSKHRFSSIQKTVFDIEGYGMFEIMAVAAFIGTFVSGIWDLRTTEIPDGIPTLMAFFGVFGWLMYSANSLVPLIYSAVFGTALLIAGWLMYRLGQWGGGDAKLFAAVAYMLPIWQNRIFAIDFVANLFIVGAVYIMIYALAAGIKNPNTFRLYKKDLAKNKKTVAAMLIVALGLCFSMLYVSKRAGIELLLPAMLFGLVLFWRYGVVVEQHVFRKRIASSELRQGDVMLESKKWDGIAESEISFIRREKKYVTIKDGVRFGPVFSIAFIITLFYGNLLFSAIL
ncbi:MAG: prepilin peptidase [Candidatus Aenigmarchaeota archaeon]|nr:prepilin peptidase [Candidatus Aenigmarchaeota archaeon]